MVQEEKTSSRQIRPYEPRDKAAVLDLILEVWGPEKRKDYDILWDWKHARDAEPDRGGCIAKVVEEGNRILGYTGAYPYRLKLAERRFWGTFGSETLTAPDARGVGVRLMRQTLRNAPVFMGAANERAGKLWVLLAGTERTEIRPVTKMIHVLDASEYLKKRKALSLLSKPANWALGALRSVRFGWASLGETGYRFEKIRRFPDRMDEFCERFAADHSNLILRDRKYLDWRFVECPVPYEKVLLWKGDDLCGYLVYRAGRVHGRKVMLIVEMLANKDCARHYGVMIREVVRVAARERVKDIQILESGCSILYGTLKRHLFFEKRENQLIQGWVNPGLGLNEKELDGVFAASRWFFTIADGDFEFIFFDQRLSEILEREQTSS